MSLYDIITLLGFGFGFVLSVILLGLSLQKKAKTFDDYAFGAVLITTLLWNGGQFLSILLTWLFGSVTGPTSHILVGIAYLGLVNMPSSIIHVHLAISFRTLKKASQIPQKNQIFILTLCYLPSLLFIIIALQNINLSTAPLFGISQGMAQLFSLWMLVALFSSILISEKLVKAFQSVSDRHFHRDMSYLLGGIAIGLLFVYIIPIYKVAYVGQYLNLTMLLSPALPMSVLAYYVYRYNFYRLVVKPSLVYSIFYALIMAIYLLGIRRLGLYLSQFPEVNAAFIEGFLLFGLVFLFQPLRIIVQTRLDKVFFKERYYYQQYLRELTESISNIVDLETLLKTISRSLTKSLKAKSCSIFVLENVKGEARIVKTFGQIEMVNMQSLANAFTATREFNLRRQLRDSRVKSALMINHIALSIPIYYQNQIISIICLAEKQTGTNYTDEEFDVLQTFANQISLALANARLVQERFQLEAQIYQSEKLNSLGLLATSIAHEIKNPLSSIKSIVQVLREDLSGEAERDLQVVINEINRLNKVLNRLLGFARPSDSSKTSFQIENVVEEVFSILKHHAELVNVQLVFETLKCPKLVSYRQNIRNVLFNLVLNSIQAMPNGGIIRISIGPVSQPDLSKSLTNISAISSNEWLLLTLTDNGPGIKTEIINKIFEPFFSTKTIGTGLGMVIVKKDLEEINSGLLIESNIDNGTIFQIFFPIEGVKPR